MQLINMRAQELTTSEIDLLGRHFEAELDWLEAGGPELNDRTLVHIRNYELPEEIFEVPVFLLPEGILPGAFARQVARLRGYPCLPLVVTLVNDQVVHCDAVDMEISQAEIDALNATIDALVEREFSSPSRFLSCQRRVHTSGEPEMVMVLIGELEPSGDIRLTGAWFDTVCVDGPLVGFIAPVETGFEISNCHEEVITRRTWKEAWDCLPWVLADADAWEDGAWVGLGASTDWGQVWEMVRLFDAELYRTRVEAWQRVRELAL